MKHSDSGLNSGCSRVYELQLTFKSGQYAISLHWDLLLIDSGTSVLFSFVGYHDLCTDWIHIVFHLLHVNRLCWTTCKQSFCYLLVSPTIHSL